MNNEDKHPKVQELFQNIKKALPELEEMQKQLNGHSYEDGLYRFYYQSYKVYYLQEKINEAFQLLKSLNSNPLTEWFVEIVKDGTKETFEHSHNKEWLKHTRPIVEAYLHCKYMVEMTVKYGKELEYPPLMLPSGWATLLCLYGVR